MQSSPLQIKSQTRSEKFSRFWIRRTRCTWISLNAQKLSGYTLSWYRYKGPRLSPSISKQSIIQLRGIILLFLCIMLPRLFTSSTSMAAIFWAEIWYFHHCWKIGIIAYLHPPRLFLMGKSGKSVPKRHDHIKEVRMAFQKCPQLRSSKGNVVNIVWISRPNFRPFHGALPVPICQGLNRLHDLSQVFRLHCIGDRCS